MIDNAVVLDYGEYVIPDGCVVRKKGNTLVIRESKSIVVNDNRCKDCKHFDYGSSTKAVYWVTTICKKKPKCVFRGVQVYYAARPYGNICDNFELKTKNENGKTEI